MYWGEGAFPGEGRGSVMVPCDADRQTVMHYLQSDNQACIECILCCSLERSAWHYRINHID